MAKRDERISRTSGAHMKGNKMEVRQQGDVVFVRVESIPEAARRDEEFNGIVQYGEATGHKHKLSGKEFDMFKFFEEGRRYLSVKSPTNLSHEEHNTIEIPPGNYEIRIVRELDWFSDMERPVVD
jgi:hypothetical protein